MPNATCIYLYEGERAPVVFDTALTDRERQGLSRWFAENPDLDSLVQRAITLAEREAERVDEDMLRELAEQARSAMPVQGFALAELRSVLAGLVAAQEELANGAIQVTESILCGLEADVAGLIEGAA
jgi:hypothetical protein